MLKSVFLKLQLYKSVFGDKDIIFIEEVSQNMYCISSVLEYVKIEVSKIIPIYSYSVTLAYNGISNVMCLKTPALECILSDT